MTAWCQVLNNPLAEIAEGVVMLLSAILMCFTQNVLHK